MALLIGHVAARLGGGPGMVSSAAMEMLQCRSQQAPLDGRQAPVRVKALPYEPPRHGQTRLR
jgi:hypothetical protein